MFNCPTFISNYLFGVKGKRHKVLFKETLKDIDSIFLRWSLEAILKWKNNKNCIRIHGGRDKNGTHPTENSEWDRAKWAYLFCREDEENDETCGSLCERNTPVIMWWTGIIEET